MSNNTEYNLGVQPLEQIMLNHGLKARDLVTVSTEQLTHKMVSRGCKGRRLNVKIQSRIRHALNALTDKSYSLEELFTY